MAVTLLCASLLHAQKNDPFQTALYLEKWQDAVRIGKQKAAASPADAYVLTDLATACVAAGQTAEGKTSLEDALKTDPQPALSYVINARLSLLAGNTVDATKWFKKAAKAGKKDVNILRLIGESWLFGKTHNWSNAEEALLNALHRNNRDFRTLMDLGYCYLSKGIGGKALVQFDLAQNSMPDNPLPAFMSSVAYRIARVDEKQLEYLDKALRIDPDFKEAMRRKAEFFYYQKHDYAAAESAYALLIQRHPDVPVTDQLAYVNCLFLDRKYDQTIEWVNKIIQQDDSRNYLRRLSAYSNYETGHYAQGKMIMDDYFKQVAPDKIIPQDYEYYGKLLQKESQDSLAAIYYEKAIAMDSSRWNLYAEIGAILYKSRDYAGAAAAYGHRLDSLETRTALDYYQAGLANFMVRDSASLEKAAEYFTRVSDIVPDKTIGWLMLAKTRSKQEPDLEAHPELSDQFGKAREAFERYIELAKSDPEKNRKDLIAAYEYMAYYYVVQEEPEQVASYNQLLLALDPENETAKGIAEWLDAKDSGD